MTHQEAVTIFAKLKPGRRDALGAVLDRINADVEANELLPFESLDKVHFARFVLLDEAKDIQGRTITPSLVYASSVDAPARDHLRQLVEEHAEAMDRIFGACEGYPTPSKCSAETRLAYLRRHTISSNAFYVNTIGRSVQQVRDEARLRDAIQDFLDREAASLADQTPAEIRQAVRDFCSSDETLQWALKPARTPPLWWKVKERLRFYAILGGLVLLSPVLLIIALVLLLRVRYLEKRDARAGSLRLSAQPRGNLMNFEDHVVQNQFSAVGNIKPERTRHIMLRLLLRAVNFSCRHYFNSGDLGSVPLLGLHGVNTIHFARWIVVDEGRRVLFLSNYDGSLASYMDDFINKVAWGLNAVFSHGESYPETRWMVLDGANNEQEFKAFLQKHQIATQVWYSAYKDSTAQNIARNAEIRAGLAGSADGKDVERWTRQL